MRNRFACVMAAGLVSICCGRAEPNEESGSRSGANTLTVGVDGPGRVLSLPPAIDCPGTCSASFEPGTSVTLAAAPLEQGLFGAWAGDCSGAMGCFVAIEGEKRVTALFLSMDPMGMGMLRR